MAFDAFLTIDAIAGPSNDKRHPGSIELISWTWGLTNNASGGVAGHTYPYDFAFVHAMDKSSPNLMLACATGRHLQTATLNLRQTFQDGTSLEFLQIKMTNVLVGAVQMTGPHNDQPTEQVFLNFTQVDELFRARSGEVVETTYTFA